MHILFLSDNFPPEVNAGASRTFEHCREWVQAGHQVTVITCAPNSPKGKVFAGYKNRLWQSETISGIRVIRVWSFIRANEGFTLRVLDYMSYMVSAVLAAPFVRKADIIVGTSPQFFTAWAAYAISRIKRKPFLFEVRDLWPESIRAVGAMKNPKILNWLERVELFLYRKAAAIICVTHSFRKNLEQRGIDVSKIKVITNGVDTSRFNPREKDAQLVEKYQLEGKFVAGYIGTLGLAQALETLLVAAAKIRETGGGDVYRFLLLGDGASKPALKARARVEGLENVIFLDLVSKDDVVRHWSLLDASIIHLKKSELFRSVIPSKLFESMAMGIPILHGVEGESAELVEHEGVGLLFEPENADALCAQLVRLHDDASLKAKLQAIGPAAAQNYDRSLLANEMLRVLQNIYRKKDKVDRVVES